MDYVATTVSNGNIVLDLNPNRFQVSFEPQAYYLLVLHPEISDGARRIIIHAKKVSFKFTDDKNGMIITHSEERVHLDCGCLHIYAEQVLIKQPKIESGGYFNFHTEYISQS